MMRATRRFILVGLSLGFVALVAISTAGSVNFLFFSILFSSAFAMIAIQRIFPSGGLFPITFASLAAVYATIFGLFEEALFYSLSKGTLGIGFALPILFFIAGCWWRRELIRTEVADWAMAPHIGAMHALLWQLPVWAIGLSLYIVFGIEESSVNTDATFLIAMAAIGVIVFAVAHEVATFLIDIGLLLEEFVTRMTRLLVPAFAFLCFYAILVIVFAAIYNLVSHGAEAHQFRIGTEFRPLSFFEALYFSVVTLATVGYGDIVPASNLVRALVAVEVIFGILLILFGVSELIEYANERDHITRRMQKHAHRMTGKDETRRRHHAKWRNWSARKLLRNAMPGIGSKQDRDYH
jgi:voltage-gated potassium channel